jgi:hypothetical protein
MDNNSIIDGYIHEQQTTPEKISYNNNHKTWFHTGMFQQKKFYRLMAHPSFAMYCLFRSHIIRGNVKSKFYRRIKNQYYDNGDLVCVLSYKEIRDKTGWYNSKISRYINYLKKTGVIRITEIDVGKRYKQQVYILGRVSQIGDDRYFIDEIINEP